jgi:ketosteroid isomerase-like protein
MSRVSSRLLPFLLVLALSGSPAALADAAQAPAAPELTKLLREFLHAASVNDRAVFDRFFADDLLYTRSAGVTITKADIMKSFDEPRAAERAATAYDADDITVHQWGDTAVVNFRLVAKMKNTAGVDETTHYRNTGTFLRRKGQWQAVAWQATRVPEKNEAEKK